MIRDEASGWVEAEVTINGRTLTFAEAMSLRVAVSNMRMFLSDQGVRQQIGVGLADGYDTHLQAIERQIIRGAK